MDYEECVDRIHHCRMHYGLYPEETALGCIISEIWTIPEDAYIKDLTDSTTEVPK